MREPGRKNTSPVHITRKISLIGDYQMTHPLLCNRCERRFDENGERYVVPLLRNRARFPLLDRLKVALPVIRLERADAFDCLSVGFSGEKIGYFGLSILWRAAVRSWRMIDSTTTTVAIDASYMEILRRYLLGETPFPYDRIVVLATVVIDPLSQGFCFVPSRVTEHTGIAYSLLVRGLYYDIVFADNHPALLQALSCIGPGQNLIFTTDASDKVHGPLAAMAGTSVVKGSLGDILGPNLRLGY